VLCPYAKTYPISDVFSAMNLPNKLTVIRLALTAVFVLCFYVPWAHSMTVALGVFAVASLTDYFDGKIARARGMVTNFGKLFDPLADKVLIAAAFILLVERTEMKAWIAIAMLGREFFVTGIRSIAANQGVVLAAEKLGKHKMVWQVITVLFFMLRAAAQEPTLAFLAPWLVAKSDVRDWVGILLVSWTALLTVGSGVSYFWKNRHLFRDA
jgi:CDP-diacylglycerol---glycerol-3-phosphate 3-phosphatidyltransferase